MYSNPVVDSYAFFVPHSDIMNITSFSKTMLVIAE